MRHGEVDYFDVTGRPFPPAAVALNAEGRRQAEAAGRLLTDVPLDRVITSGLPRAVETANLVIAPRVVPLETRTELREIEPARLADLGDVLGTAVEQAFLNALHPMVQRDSRFLGGETFGSLVERVWPCFQQLLAERDWQHLLVVAHGVVNITLLSHVLGAGLAGIGTVEQDNGCINILDVEDSGRCLVRLLNHSPLNPLKVGAVMTSMERLYVQYTRGRC
jgi:broad specificity phosphatase PhoE